MRLPPFQTLLEEHGEDVLRYLRAAVGRQDAEDCWQETMLSALRAYPRLRDSRNLRGWMLRIAHNEAVDHHRSTRRRPLPTPDLPERGAPVREADPELWTAVRRLPEKQRAAVTLRFAGDLDYRAIGSLIDCSEAAARQNVRAGLAAVRKEWAHAGAS
ncbi:MAG TPA: sigma-70 family RNA polymerase sigma factor [Gaiellales bacterium]|jgi:RNA polymerase sigma factor (sigma-70 family)|nr:sigma-70 family RNA polymerase sigma factor [Gaiellales bacterium]